MREKWLSELYSQITSELCCLMQSISLRKLSFIYQYLLFLYLPIVKWECLSINGFFPHSLTYSPLRSCHTCCPHHMEEPAAWLLFVSPQIFSFATKILIFDEEKMNFSNETIKSRFFLDCSCSSNCCCVRLQRTHNNKNHLKLYYIGIAFLIKKIKVIIIIIKKQHIIFTQFRKWGQNTIFGALCTNNSFVCVPRIWTMRKKLSN